MSQIFDLTKFDEYREDNRREVKSAKGGLPASLWDTYSAFANSQGGVIILGVRENEDKSWQTTGLQNPAKIYKEFWDMIHNPVKVSLNLLTDDDVELYDVGGDTIMVIHVPMARREEKPIYLNDNIFKYTYRRNGEGDYRCTKSQVLAMLRDQTEETSDMKVIDYMQLSDLNQDTIRGYRNMHKSLSDQHPFSRLTDDEYLRSIGAAAVSKTDGKLHPTAAGLLMFGNDYDIVQEYPEYFLDFQEHLDPTIRWTDRLWSTSGTWSGNVFDFFLRAYSKIALGLKVPFQMQGIQRVDDTPVHKAVREALVNCLSNADFFCVRGVVIQKMPDRLILENPGYIRTGKRQMIQGGTSDPRNKTMLKMFNLLDIGERAGSGVPNIFNVWADEGWEEPIIEEENNPDRTRLILIFEKNNRKKQSEKTIGKNNRKKQSEKTQLQKTKENKAKIEDYLRLEGENRTSEIAEYMGLSIPRVRVMLREMIEEGVIEAEGEGRARVYKVANISEEM